MRAAEIAQLPPPLTRIAIRAGRTSSNNEEYQVMNTLLIAGQSNVHDFL